jgi:hypothetical protein
MAAAENSRMLRVVASVPVLSFPPPPKPSHLGFHRAYLLLLDGKNYLKYSMRVMPANQSHFSPHAFFCFVRLAFQFGCANGFLEAGRKRLKIVSQI